jgi:hypothetical protein
MTISWLVVVVRTALAVDAVRPSAFIYSLYAQFAIRVCC